jgi:hypothetical protein
MKRSALSIIYTFKIHAFFLKIVEWYWLVTLSGNMQYINPKVIPRIDICSFSNEQFNEFDIPPEWCEM